MKMFNKIVTNKLLANWEWLVYDGSHNCNFQVRQMINKYGRVFVKPADGGSSINVYSINSLEFEIPIGYLVEEPHKGIEFSISVCHGKAYEPVEIEYENGKFFDYTAKYFPSDHVRLYCPARFSFQQKEDIQLKAERLFNSLGAKDAIRLDGWIKNNGEIIITDINPVPSLEFIGIFFQSFCLPNYIVFQILLKNYINFRDYSNKMLFSSKDLLNEKTIPIIVGGETDERDVSLQSGTAVAMKLLHTEYNPILVLFHANKIIILPFYAFFKHSIFDVVYFYKNYGGIVYDLEEFIKIFSNRFIFIALHGGTLQFLFENYKIQFNGESSTASAIGMNKLLFSSYIPEYSLESSTDWSVLRKYGKCILKPIDNGCSVNISLISSNEISEETIFPHGYMCQRYISSDSVAGNCSKLITKGSSGWYEFTMGYYGDVLFTPSLTIASGEILSVRDKFEEGTGVNLTPPSFLTEEKIDYIHNIFKKIKYIIGLKYYGRFDFFFNIKTSELYVLEVNTLPALTFSTVLYTQAYISGYEPKDFILGLIHSGKNRYSSKEEQIILSA